MWSRSISHNVALFGANLDYATLRLFVGPFRLKYGISTTIAINHVNISRTLCITVGLCIPYRIRVSLKAKNQFVTPDI